MQECCLRKKGAMKVIDFSLELINIYIVSLVQECNNEVEIFI